MECVGARVAGDATDTSGDGRAAGGGDGDDNGTEGADDGDDDAGEPIERATGVEVDAECVSVVEFAVAVGVTDSTLLAAAATCTLGPMLAPCSWLAIRR